MQQFKVTLKFTQRTIAMTIPYYGTTLIVILAGIFVASCTGSCRIDGPDSALTFFVTEVPENYPVGTKLPKSIRIVKTSNERNINVQSYFGHSELSAGWDYIEAKYSKNDTEIDFYLKKPLSEFRKNTWSPSIEIEFRLPCLDDNNLYTYMVTIQDDNLYSPHFESKNYTGELKYSTANGFKTHVFDPFPPPNEEVILSYLRVTDEDFNLKHCNLSVICNGSHCAYFNFRVGNASSFEKGNNFEVFICLNTTMALANPAHFQDDEIIQLDLVVSDTKHSSTTTVSFHVALEDQIGGSEESKFPLVPLLIAGIITAFIIIACSGTVVVQTVRNRKARNILRQLTEAEIREFLEGTVNFAGNDSNSKRSVDVNTPIMAQPYNKNFEIPREKLRIDETTVLGTGAFGIVWKGSVMYSNGEGITVAVKSVRRNVGVLYFKALLSELKIMAYIGKHSNIVSLVGACTHNIRKREVYIAVQYCANGNFHDYLKYRRDRFSDLVVDGKLQLTNSVAQSYIYSNKACFSKSISTLDLLKWATQIANGLQYLESLGVIHGDLATRNVMLDSERVAKIGDFGLSRRLIDYSNYYYTKSSQAPLPWKWMSPESLKDMKFSKKSDIWSFGIVLWEIFTLGQTPYPGLNWDETFVERLEKGMRPNKPVFATDDLFNVLTDCWNLEPHDRPCIFDIKRVLENMTKSGLRQRTDLSYMSFFGETHFMTLLPESDDGYLIPNNRENRTNLYA